jgi:hydroxymethylpyrimidine/phosphomethylpyrimidine kinase
LSSYALTISGSDPSGGAGIQADLKTFQQFGVYGQAAIALLTVQNTLGVSRVVMMEPELVEAQIRAVLDDIPPHAAKLGALGNAAMVRMIATLSTEFSFPLVVDPVMISKHGARLVASDADEAYRLELLPRTFLLTPNLHEASVLTGTEVDSQRAMRHAAQQIAEMGCRHVLIKGGHLPGDPIDLLYTEGSFHEFVSARVDTQHTHGTGCTYSAAITAELARGRTVIEAVQIAKDFISSAIRTNPGLGQGTGPVNFFASILEL